MLLAALISSHDKWDVALWICYFMGQCLYILKRAAMGIRSPTNPIKSRRAFVYQNWDILLFRTAVEFIFPFYPARHVSPMVIAGWFGWPLPTWIPPNFELGMLGFFGLGIASDTILDWASQSSKVPSVIRKFIAEQVPDVPQPPTVTVTTEVTGMHVETSAEIKKP